MSKVSNFGKDFKKYQQFKIAHLSFPNTNRGRQNIINLGTKVKDINMLTKLSPAPTHRLSAERNLLVLTSEQLSRDAIKNILKDVIVKVAPVARVYPISPEQPDLAEEIKNTLPYFNYYFVELGLNVMVGREAKIPNLKFEADLYSDGIDRTDVTTNSVAPTDSIKTVLAVDGKMTIGINKLLQLIPGPIGTVIPNLLGIDLNPISFKWALQKYEIDTSGPLDYNASWRIYETDNVQSFNPIMILKAKKKISKISAKVRVTYELKTSILSDSQFRSKAIKVPILPFT